MPCVAFAERPIERAGAIGCGGGPVRASLTRAALVGVLLVGAFGTGCAINPVSGWIRMEMLRILKRQAEAG